MYEEPPQANLQLKKTFPLLLCCKEKTKLLLFSKEKLNGRSTREKRGGGGVEQTRIKGGGRGNENKNTYTYAHAYIYKCEIPALSLSFSMENVTGNL